MFSFSASLSAIYSSRSFCSALRPVILVSSLYSSCRVRKRAASPSTDVICSSLLFLRLSIPSVSFSALSRASSVAVFHLLVSFAALPADAAYSIMPTVSKPIAATSNPMGLAACTAFNSAVAVVSACTTAVSAALAAVNALIPCCTPLIMLSIANAAL